MDKDDTYFMRMALEEAMAAADAGEIPVGAVVVRGGEPIARGRNDNRARNNPAGHAELNAIQSAARVLGNERLVDCVLYVTKEPCSMCAGAMVHARIARVVIAAEDAKYGACGTVLSVCGNERLNHVPEIEFGLLRDESIRMLSDFFRNLRKK
ncbi:MAG: nucleoside deaminase [Spirochaetes bacterium]|nr:MAG: nucleoside deaminase [Spirochaetota bacterium]